MSTAKSFTTTQLGAFRALPGNTESQTYSQEHKWKQLYSNASAEIQGKDDNPEEKCMQH